MRVPTFGTGNNAAAQKNTHQKIIENANKTTSADMTRRVGYSLLCVYFASMPWACMFRDESMNYDISGRDRATTAV